MDNLKECIDYLNLFSTLSLRNSYVLRYQNTPLEHPNFNDSVSLNNFLYSFGKMYKSFSNDYKKLPKFNLGKSFQYWDYSEYGSEKETTLLIYEPNIVDNDFCYLNIVKNNDGIKSYISTDDHQYYLKNTEINLDKSFAEKYFDFIEKYLHFMDCFNLSKSNIMFSNQHYSIMSDYEGSIYNKLYNILLKIDMDYKDKNYIAEIMFDLDNLHIDYDKSLIKGIDGNKMEIINAIVNGIYINKDRIASTYYDNDDDKVLRLKKGLDI